MCLVIECMVGLLVSFYLDIIDSVGDGELIIDMLC